MWGKTAPLTKHNIHIRRQGLNDKRKSITTGGYHRKLHHDRTTSLPASLRVTRAQPVATSTSKTLPQKKEMVPRHHVGVRNTWSLIDQCFFIWKPPLLVGEKNRKNSRNAGDFFALPKDLVITCQTIIDDFIIAL